MSLKVIDRHFTGAMQTRNYEFYLQLVNHEEGHWVQGTKYKQTMDVYGTLVQPPKTKTPDSDYYDTHEYIQLTDYQKHLGSVVWNETKQQWEGTLPIGELTIKKRGTSIYGWPAGKSRFGNPWDSSTFDIMLYGLLDCGDRPMRVFQVTGKPYTTNAFLLQLEPHTMTDLPDQFKVINNSNFVTEIGTWTLHAIYWTPYMALGSGQWLGYRSFQYEENVQYNRRTKTIVNKTITETQLSGPTDPSRVSTITRATTFHNRRRYHVTPEEEWFHTSCNPKILHSGVPNTSAFQGYTEFEYGGDIVSAGCAVADLAWGTLGVTGGNTFLTQIDYDWILGTPDYQSIGHPPGVTKFIDVRRWIWKDLQVSVPRVKLRITTPEGSAVTCWLKAGSTSFVDNADNGILGAGQAWPADDAPPDYPGQGGTGRVPDLIAYPFGSMPTPDSGVSDPLLNGMGLALGLSTTQNLTRNSWSPDYLNNHTITIEDDTKLDGWLPSFLKLQESTKGHDQDRYIRNGWLSTPRYIWGWPESLSLTISGLTGLKAVLNGSYSLPLRNASGSYIATQFGLSGTAVGYGRSFYGVGPSQLLYVSLSNSNGVWYIYYATNGPVDLLVGRAFSSIELTGKVNFLGPITLPVKGFTGASVSLVPS